MLKYSICLDKSRKPPVHFSNLRERVVNTCRAVFMSDAYDSMPASLSSMSCFGLCAFALACTEKKE